MQYHVLCRDGLILMSTCSVSSFFQRKDNFFNDGKIFPSRGTKELPMQFTKYSYLRQVKLMPQEVLKGTIGKHLNLKGRQQGKTRSLTPTWSSEQKKWDPDLCQAQQTDLEFYPLA